MAVNPDRETEKHLTAFEYYYALGRSRKLAEVARRFKVSAQSINTWSMTFGWQNRVLDRSKIVAERIAEKAIEEEIESRIEQLALCRRTMQRYSELITPPTNPDGTPELGEDGKPKPAKLFISPGDFVKVAQHERLLRGLSTENQEIRVTSTSFDNLIDRIAQAIETTVPEKCIHCGKPNSIRAELADKINEAADSLDGGSA